MMKHMKSILLLLLAAVLVLSAGCGNSAETKTGDGGGTAPLQEPVKVDEPPEDSLMGVYLGSDESFEQLRFFQGGREHEFAPGSVETPEALTEGAVYYLTVKRDKIREIYAVGEEKPYSASTVDPEARFWRVGLASTGVTVKETLPPEEGTSVLIAKEDDRTDVYLPLSPAGYTPAVSGQKGVMTRKNLLSTAFAPAGHTLFVLGGEASSEDGPMPAHWADFFSWQDETYSYTDFAKAGLHMYSRAGTDGMGYITWVLGRVLQPSQPLPRDAALIDTLVQMGLGTKVRIPQSASESDQDGETGNPLLPGDLLCFTSEVWICLGVCPDGSMPVLRCAPTPSHTDAHGGGVQVSAVGQDEECLAYRLAQDLVQGAYPDWSGRYDVQLLDPELASSTYCLRWTALADDEELSAMTPRQVITELFGGFPGRENDTQMQVEVSPAWFDDAVFIGDSVTERLRMYCEETGALSGAQFLSGTSLSAVNALWKISDESVHPLVNGVKTRVEDGVAMSGAKNVYIMLGINSIAWGPQQSLDDLETLVGLICEKSPGVSIIMESVTPMTTTSTIANDSLNNTVIDNYNQSLYELCQENGWYFVDVASVMKDDYGALIRDYCSDPNNMGIHMTNAGAEAWIDYLLTHVPEELT